MKRLMKWLVLTAAAPTLCGVNCGLTLRDAVLGGAMDYVSGTTTNALSSLLPLDTLFGQRQ